MERNENGYSSYNLMPDRGAHGGSPMNANSGGDCMENGACPMRCGAPEGSGMMNDGHTARLAFSYLPIQCWRMLYDPDYGLTRGTMFEELDLPLEDCVNG